MIKSYQLSNRPVTLHIPFFFLLAHLGDADMAFGSLWAVDQPRRFFSPFRCTSGGHHPVCTGDSPTFAEVSQSEFILRPFLCFFPSLLEKSGSRKIS